MDGPVPREWSLPRAVKVESHPHRLQPGRSEGFSRRPTRVSGNLRGGSEYERPEPIDSEV